MEYLNIFKWILESSIISSILVLIIFLLRAIVKGRLSPNFLYYMWLVVIVKLLVPFGVESSLSIYNVFNNTSISEKFNFNIHTKMDTDINQNKIISKNKINNSIISENNNTNDNLLAMNELPRENFEKTTILKESLFIVWLLGTTFFICCIFFTQFKLNNIIKHSKSNKNIDIKNLKKRVNYVLGNCLRILKIKQKVQIIMVDTISSPCLYGIIHPTIFIKKEIINQVTDEELKYILLHELCHLKRKDNIINYLICVIKSVYWFNPIILYAFSIMEADCEISCDAMVLKHIDKKESISYGKTIIHMLKYINDSNQGICVTSIISNKQKIKGRIIMIGKNKKFGFKSFILGIILILILIVTGLTTKNIDPKAENNINQISVLNSEQKINEESKFDNYQNISKKNDVIIYNSHKEEKYENGYTINDVDNMVSSKLNEKGFNSIVLENNKYTGYNDAYINSKELIKENVKDYRNSILLDIHTDAKQENNNMKIVLAKNNPNFNYNREFAESIINNIDKNNLKLVTYNRGKGAFNQDLSNKAILLEIGNEGSTKEEINKETEAIVDALNLCIKKD